MLQVRRSVRQIQAAQFTLDLQNRNIELSRLRLKGVLLRMEKLGTRDFLDAQSDLLNARNLRDAAERDLRVNILQFLLDSDQLRVNPQGQWVGPGRLVPTTQPATQPTTRLSDPSALLRAAK